MSGPKCSEFSVKQELAELIGKMVARECLRDELLAVMIKTRADIKERLAGETAGETAGDRQSFYRDELQNLSDLSEELLPPIEREARAVAAAAAEERVRVNEKADALVRARRYDEASQLIRETAEARLSTDEIWNTRAQEVIRYVENAADVIKLKYSAIPVSDTAQAAASETAHAAAPGAARAVMPVSDDENIDTLMSRVREALDAAGRRCEELPEQAAGQHRAALERLGKDADAFYARGAAGPLKNLLYNDLPRQANLTETDARRHRLLKTRIERLIIRYNVLCARQNRKPFSRQNYPEDEDFAREMEERADRLQNELVKAREQAYIHETVDRLLRGMGHTAAGGRDYPDSGAPELYRSKLYQYRQGTAVKASFSTNGEVLLEIVGVSDSRRQPTEAESTQLYGDMEGFCREYDDIKIELGKMGVLMDRIYERPADRRYARVENINDYRLEPDFSIESLLAETQTSAGVTLKARYLDGDING